MKISFDKTIDTKYVSIKKGKIATTKKICEWLFFDLNSKNEVLGVEVLGASKNSLSLFTDGQNLIHYEFEISQANNFNFFLNNVSKFGPSQVIDVPLQYV